MKNAIISAMVLTMFVLVTTKVFAHGEGECLTGVFSGNANYIKVLSHPDSENGNHRHQEGYYNSLGVLQSKWFAESNWEEGDDDNYGRCPTRQSTRRRSQRSPVNSCDPEPAPVGFTCDDLRVRVGEICHEWDFRESSFVGIPVLPDSIETVGDLWNYFHDLTGREIDIKYLLDGMWYTYKGRGLGAIPITPHSGIGVDERTIGFIDSPIGITGNQVQGEIVTLEKPEGEPHRYHFVGFPESPIYYPTFGDLLVRDVSYVRRRIVIDGQIDYQFIYTTNSEGADEMIQPGDAVVMLITGEVTLDLTGSVSAAPSIKRKGTLAMSWGAMKRR